MTRRTLVMRRQRSAGRHLVGPVYASGEWHSYRGVRYVRVSVGNPRRHYWWAFSAWLYLTVASRNDLDSQG